MLEIDFSLIEDKAESKVFRLTNEAGGVYDMAGSTAICKLYLDPENPLDIVSTIDVPNGTITVPFTTTHSDNQGTFEYIIEETRTVAPTGVVPVVGGNIAVLQYTPFSESLEAYLRSELPANLTLTVDYRNQRIMYWRRILQAAFEITDANINTESAWPTLVNALLAKLVVYDALVLAVNGSFIQFLGGDYTSTSTITSGEVKSIETGPTKVEYYSSATSAKDAVSANAGGTSMLSVIKDDICGLANFLEVKVHMCEQMKNSVSPAYVQNSNWEGTALPDL